MCGRRGEVEEKKSVTDKKFYILVTKISSLLDDGVASVIASFEEI